MYSKYDGSNRKVSMIKLGTSVVQMDCKVGTPIRSARAELPCTNGRREPHTF